MKMNDILPMILAEVPGCPDYTARIAVLRAAQELCKISGIWREWLDEIQLQAGTAEYEVVPSDQGIVDTVVEAWVGNCELTPKSHAEINLLIPDWRTCQSVAPLYYNVDGPRASITVYPTPSETTGALRIKAKLFPTLTATSLQDDLFNHYGDAIEMGAKARLFLMAKQSWTDLKLGSALKGEFVLATADARINEEAGQVNSQITVRPRAFG